MAKDVHKKLAVCGKNSTLHLFGYKMFKVTFTSIQINFNQADNDAFRFMVHYTSVCTTEERHNKIYE